MKKVLSFVLVLSLVLGSVSMAFATTTNTVSKVPTVADGNDFTAELTLEVNDAAGITNPQKIKLTIENGQWIEDVDTDDLAKAVTTAAITTANAISVIDSQGTPTAATALSIGDKYIEFTFTPSNTLTKAANDYIKLELNIEAGDTEGEVKVKVDGLDSQISSGTYAVAIVGTDNTVATVSGDPELTGRATNVKCAVIEIRETAVNSISGDQKIKLSLPKGVKWNSNMQTSASALIKGDMVGTLTGASISTDGRDLFVDFVASNSSVRDVLTITPYIDVTKDAKLGDIAVQVRSQLSGDNKIDDESGLVVAKYSEEGVTVSTVKEADLPEILAGRIYEDLDEGDRYEIEITIEELQDKSLIAGKFVDFTFPEYVQLVSGEAIEVETDITDLSDAAAAALCDPTKGTYDEDDNSFEWEVPSKVNDGKANEITFTIPVTVEADAPAGDLEVVVSGSKAGVDETKLVVAKIITPITAEVKLSDIKTGVQDQATADIIIKENVAGALCDDSGNNELRLWISDNSQNISFGEAYAEVVAGDLELEKAADKDLVNNGVIVVKIERSSIKTPGEIKLSGILVTLDRTPAEGKYKVKIGGNALVNNTLYRGGNGIETDFASAVVSTEYINVVTPADQGVNATFKIGEAKYTVNGTEVAMDTASYIDANGRTMVPIRYIANALGVSENQIVWNQATQTATIFGKSTVVVTMGSSTLTVNGSVVPMDTVAVNNNGRIFVPLRYIANALGASADWDNATRTASVFTAGK